MRRKKQNIANDLKAIKFILDEVEERLNKIKSKAGESNMADIASITAKIADLNTAVDAVAAKHTGGISAADAQTIEDALTGVVTKLQGLAAA